MTEPQTDITATVFELGDLQVDPVARRVSRGDDSLDITGLSFDLLMVLARACPDPVSPEQLAETVWQQSHVSEDTLSQRIALVRKALGETAKHPRYIRTVRHKGYALMVAPAAPWTRPKTTFRKEDFILGALLLAIIIPGLVLLNSGWFSLDDTPAPTEQTSEPPMDMGLAVPLDRARQLLDLHQPAATDEAIHILETAFEAYPEHTSLKRQLSFALTTRLTKFSPHADDQSRAEQLARSLVEDDPGHGANWHALAYALDARGQIDEALAAYQQAVLLDPEDANARSSAAYLLRVRGRLHESLTAEAEALASAPPSLYAPVQIASSLSLAGHPAADMWWQRALEAGASNSVTQAEWLGGLLARGDVAGALAHIATLPEALRELDRIRHLEGLALAQAGRLEAAREHMSGLSGVHQIDQAALAMMLDGIDRRDDLRAALQDARQNGQAWPDIRLSFAALDAQAGDLDAAFALLSEAIDLGWRNPGQLRFNPVYAPVRQDPRWEAIEARIERERAAQRRLIEHDPALAILLQP